MSYIYLSIEWCLPLSLGVDMRAAPACYRCLCKVFKRDPDAKDLFWKRDAHRARLHRLPQASEWFGAGVTDLPR